MPCVGCPASGTCSPRSSNGSSPTDVAERAEATSAAELLARVIGQDIDETWDGRFVIAQGVAPGSGDQHG
jgi:hypothetical protein